MQIEEIYRHEYFLGSSNFSDKTFTFPKYLPSSAYLLSLPLLLFNLHKFNFYK